MPLDEDKFLALPRREAISYAWSFVNSLSEQEQPQFLQLLQERISVWRKLLITLEIDGQGLKRMDAISQWALGLASLTVLPAPLILGITAANLAFLSNQKKGHEGRVEVVREAIDRLENLHIKMLTTCGAQGTK